MMYGGGGGSQNNVSVRVILVTRDDAWNIRVIHHEYHTSLLTTSATLEQRSHGEDAGGKIINGKTCG